MIEDFDLKHKDFFNEPDYMKRWKSLFRLYEEDYGSFRVLFYIEVLALIDKWDEPSVENLNKLLNHVIAGDRIRVRIGSLIDLFTPVWPLEAAKYDLMLFKTFSKNYHPKNFFFTSIKITMTALVQI